ncbi:MAG: hypothetical protein FJX42_01345 [Alphaproteobacteria bacterium]|nr:hypothetical protein [Alphaproteobacteria bacterium]
MRKKPDGTSAAVSDAHLWRAVTDSARPLKSKRRKTHAPAPPKAASVKPAAPPAKPPQSVRPSPPPRPVPAALRTGAVADMDRRTAARFKKGEMPIEEALDLHGMTQESAHAALGPFLARSRAAGRRCVLVITGKGTRGGESAGVLRANVPRWLNEPGPRAHILAFAHAHARHGGEGALYVLLKRLRRGNAS